MSVSSSLRAISVVAKLLATFIIMPTLGFTPVISFFRLFCFVSCCHSSLNGTQFENMCPEFALEIRGINTTYFSTFLDSFNLQTPKNMTEGYYSASLLGLTQKSANGTQPNFAKR